MNLVRDRILPPVLVLFLFYLLGTFVTWNFDVSAWPSEGRFFMAIPALIAAFVAIVARSDD